MRKKHGKMKNKILLAIAAILVVGGISGGIFLSKNVRAKEVTNFSPEFETVQTRETTEAGVTAGIRIPGYSTIFVEPNTTNVSVDLENPIDNHVYFEISFYLPETEETIYTSKLIEPGQHLYQIELNRALNQGEYPLTIRYATYSMDESYTPKNGAEVNCILSVQ